MEIRKMTCPKCGGTVKLDGNLAGGVCPSCGSKFGLGSEAPLTVPETKPAAAVSAPSADDYRPGAPAARGRLSMADQKREDARREEAARQADGLIEKMTPEERLGQLMMDLSANVTPHSGIRPFPLHSML